MLTGLSAKNFALFDDMEVEFSKGLNVITGETGSGKTLLFEALGLVLGDRAGSQYVRKGAGRAAVTAVFSLSVPRVKALLGELDLVPEGADMILRREIDESGKSRCFANDRPVGLATLSRLGETLVYWHGQHEHQLLLKPAEQRDLLDAFGRLEEERQAVSEAHRLWKDLESEAEALTLSDQERAQRADLYRFQGQELKTADLKRDEDAELEKVLPQLKNAEKLKALSGEAYDLLYGQEGAVLDKISRVQRSLESLDRLGAGLPEALGLVREAAVRLEEVSAQVEALSGRVDLDPARLDETLSRMDLLAKLKRKYGPTLDEVLAYEKKVTEELGRLENAEERNRDLAERRAKAEKDLRVLSEKLSRARTAAARKLSAAVKKEFQELGLGRAEFDVSVEKDGAGGFSPSGTDAVRFLLSPNPGEGKQPLAAVASGGELSRVMLALKTVLAEADAVPTLIFDEIDAGVGGTLGGAVGKKLARLGKSHQTLCITHLPAIAACALSHVAVEKETAGERTRARVKALSGEDRVAEIARMFGSPTGRRERSALSVEHARELLEGVVHGG